jgi:hypothetical protein
LAFCFVGQVSDDSQRANVVSAAVFQLLCSLLHLAFMARADANVTSFIY